MALALIILVLSTSVASGISVNPPTTPTQGVELISASSSKLIYETGEDVRISIVTKNLGSSPLVNASLDAIITSEDSAFTQRFQLKDNININPLEEKIFNGLLLWRIPNNSSQIYDVTVELKDSSGATLFTKHNALAFKINGNGNGSSILLLHNAKPPAAKVSYRPAQPTSNDKLTFSINATSETSLSTITLYLDKYKPFTWLPVGKSFSISQKLGNLTAGIHYYRVEVRDSSKVETIQDSVFVTEPAPKCPKKFIYCLGASHSNPVNLRVVTLPPTMGASFRLDDFFDFFTGADGSVQIKVMPGSNHTLGIVNDTVSINEFEKELFKSWLDVHNPGQKNLIVNVDPDNGLGLNETMSLIARFDLHYKMQFTTAGLPDGVNIKLNVGVPDHFKNWSNDYKTPFTFVMPDWLESSSLVRFSVEPYTVTVAGVQYSFSHWDDSDGRVLTYSQNAKISSSPSKMIAVYKAVSSRTIQEAESSLPNLPEVPQLITPHDGTKLESGSINLLASYRSSSIADNFLNFYLDDNSVGTSKIDANGHGSLTLRAGLDAGKHHWYVSARDASGKEVKSNLWEFSYWGNDIGKIKIESARLNDQSLFPGQTLFLDLTIASTAHSSDHVKLRTSIYDPGNNVISSDDIYEFDPNKSDHFKIDGLYLWQIPVHSRLGSYSVSVELIDSDGVTQDSKSLRFGVAPNSKTFTYKIDLTSWNSVSFDLAKSRDDDSDRKKDAYVDINLPFGASKLGVLMNVEPDDIINMILFSPDGKMLTNSTNTKGISERIDVSNPQKGLWKLHVIGTSIGGSDAFVKIQFYLVNDEVSLESVNVPHWNYTSDSVNILGTVKNMDSLVKKVTIKYEIVNQAGFLKQTDYAHFWFKGNSTKTVSKFVKLGSDFPPGTYYALTSIYVEKNHANYTYESQRAINFSILPNPRDAISVKIEDSRIGDLDVWVGMFGGREVLIKGHDPSNGSTSATITQDMTELGFDTSGTRLPIYLKVRDIAKNNEGKITHVSVSQNGYLYESSDEAPISSRSITVFPLFKLDALIYVKAEGQNASELALSPVSLDVTKSRLLYQKLIESLMPFSDLSFNPCVFQEPLSDPAPALCVDMKGNSLLAKDIILKVLTVANGLDKYSLTLLEPSLLGYFNYQLPLNGLVLVNSDEHFFDSYYNGTLADHVLLPQYIDDLRSKARTGNLVQGIQTSDAIDQIVAVASSHLASNSTDAKKVAKFCSDLVNKNGISYLLDSLSNKLKKDVASQIKLWIEYYRASSVVEERKGLGESFKEPRDIAIAYAKDYIDRHDDVAKTIVPSGFDHVLSNVQVSTDQAKSNSSQVSPYHVLSNGQILTKENNKNSTKITTIDLVYVKQGKIVAMANIDLHQNLAIRTLQFDNTELTNYHQVSASGKPSYHASIKLPLTNMEINEIFARIK